MKHIIGFCTALMASCIFLAAQSTNPPPFYGGTNTPSTNAPPTNGGTNTPAVSTPPATAWPYTVVYYGTNNPNGSVSNAVNGAIYNQMSPSQSSLVSQFVKGAPSYSPTNWLLVTNGGLTFTPFTPAQTTNAATAQALSVVSSNIIRSVLFPSYQLSNVWVLIDAVNGNDSTALTNSTSNPCLNLQTAVMMIVTNGGKGTILTIPGQSNSLDTLGTECWVSNNCSINLQADGCQFVTTNTSFGAVWTFGTNSTYVENNASFILPNQPVAGGTYLYGSFASGGNYIYDFERYGGTSITPGDCWLSFGFGNNPSGAFNTNLFPRLTVIGANLIGSWDIGLIPTGAKSATNCLCQFINDTITITNDIYTGGGTMHGISVGNAVSIFMGDTFNITNNEPGGWNIQPIPSTGPVAIINCTFNTAGQTTGNVTNITFGSHTKILHFPELYNCTGGTNLWLTGSGAGSSFLNIRTRDGQLYSEQVYP